MIRKAGKEDIHQLTGLALALWPEHTEGELEEDLTALLEKPEAAFFLAFREGLAVGFAQCQLRRDYVEGTETSPVGYLEGIFVAEGWRGRGIARQLLSACEDWAKGMGAVEFASDCELTNVRSLAFHRKVGFTEANRIICFTKRLTN